MLVYFSKDCTFLFRRLLEEASAAAKVCVLCAARDAAAAREVADQCGMSVELFDLTNAEAVAGVLREKASITPVDAELILPLPIDDRPLHYSEETTCPDLAPWYPLFRNLRSLGFKTFTLYSLHGRQSLSMPQLLDSFRDAHKGERCFVVGNGPSLNELDMPRLKDEIVLGSNRAYLGFEEWGFSFPYWAISDWYQIETYGREYEACVPSDTVAFHPFDYLPMLRFPNACPIDVRVPRRPAFSNGVTQLDMGHSVTYVLLQLAVVMGCNPIILVGVDHSYHLTPPPLKQRLTAGFRNAAMKPIRGTAVYAGLRAWRRAQRRMRGAAQRREHALWDASRAASPTHFDGRYAGGEEKRFALPEPRAADRDFTCAARWARAHGIEILNATPNSALTAFPMTAFDGLF